MRSVGRVLHENHGAEAPEWIGMTAVIMILLAMLYTAFTAGGPQIGAGITSAVRVEINRWTSGDAGAANIAAPQGSGPAAALPAAPASNGLAVGDNAGGWFDQVGGFVKGFVVDGLWNTVKGLAGLAKDGVVLSPGLGDLIELFAPGTRAETLAKYEHLIEAIGKDPPGALYALIEPMVTAWKDGEYGRAIGMGTFEIAQLFLPESKIGELGKVAEVEGDLGKLAKIGEVESEAGKLAKVEELLASIEKMSPEELGALLKRTDLTPEELAALERRLKQLSPEDLARIPCSFSGDTLVSTQKGFAPIRTIRPGDLVLAYNSTTGLTNFYPVLATLPHTDMVLVTLNLGGEIIKTTPEHPFYTVTGKWVPAGQLHVGEQLRQSAGAGLVQALTVEPHRQVMYNLSVAVAHTYFVGKGAWLVHNTCETALLAKYGADGQRLVQLLGEDAAKDVLQQFEKIADIEGADRLLKDLAAGSSTTQGALAELKYATMLKEQGVEIEKLADVIDGKKAGDLLIKNGPVVDVKDLDWNNSFYQKNFGIEQAQKDLIKQVSRYGELYPGRPIRYAFTDLAHTPPEIIDTLKNLGVEVTSAR
ncbi:MAG: polymorphic toxin-type HINT domain-containing protein [Caldilineaceae bacterium]